METLAFRVTAVSSTDYGDGLTINSLHHHAVFPKMTNEMPLIFFTKKNDRNHHPKCDLEGSLLQSKQRLGRRLI